MVHDASKRRYTLKDMQDAEAAVREAVTSGDSSSIVFGPLCCTHHGLVATEEEPRTKVGKKWL